MRLLVHSIIVAGLTKGRQVPSVEPEGQNCSRGIDLTSSYGTAAIACNAGSSRPLAKVNGSAQYINIMHHLSHSSFWPPRQYKSYPRPSPPNLTVVAALADMVQSLRSEVEIKLSKPVAAAAITVSHLSQLYDVTILAACDAIGLEYIQILNYTGFRESLTYHENALLAGHGLGLCQPITIEDHSCISKPVETYYLIGYYANGIEAVLTNDVGSAYEVEPIPYANFSLGSSMRYVNPREEYYWEEVRKFISLPLAGTVARRPTKIILHGDMGGDKKFRQVVNETLQRYSKPGEKQEWI